MIKIAPKVITNLMPYKNFFTKLLLNCKLFVNNLTIYPSCRLVLNHNFHKIYTIVKILE